MRIRGFHIDGFGIFHDQGVQDIPDGLVFFIGENESGKTTLMEFIRTVLFGFPRRDTRNDCPPLRGGNAGGRLQVEIQSGQRFTIERTRRNVTLAEDGGASQQAEPSERVLGGVDRQTFERVFAVGLDELQGLDILSQESVRSRLFAAGAGLGAASVPSIMKDLDIEITTLLSRQGRQQRINKFVKRLKEIELQIRELEGQASEYARCQRERAELKERIEEARSKEENIRQRLRRIEQLAQAREKWVRLCKAREKAVELEFAKGFPLNGLERFERLKEDIEEIGQGKKGREDEATQLEKRFSELKVDEAFIEHRQAIETLVGEREKLVSALNDHPILKSRRQQAEEESERRLRELGKDWHSERLAQVDTSVQVRQHVQDFGRRLDTAEREHEQAQVYQRTTQEAETETKRIREKAQRQLDELPKPPEMEEQKLRQSQDAVRMMRSLFHRRDMANTRLEAKHSAQKDAETRLASVQKQMDMRVKQLPSWTPIGALAAGVALAAMLAMQQSYVPAVVMFLVGVAIAALFHTLRRRGSEGENARLSQLHADKQQVEQTQRTLVDETTKLEQELGIIAKEIDRLAHDTDIDRPNEVTQLERLAGQLEHVAERLREWKTREGKRNEAEERRRSAQTRLEEAEQKTKNAFQELQQLQDEWQRWLTERGFADTIRPEGFEAVMQAVESARVSEQTLHEVCERLDQMDAYIASMRSNIRDLLDVCGRTLSGAEVQVEDLDILRLDLRIAIEAQRQRGELKRQIEAASSEKARLSEQLNDNETQLKELMEEAGATNEEEFRRVAESHDEWFTHREQIETDELALCTIAGTPEAQISLETELSKTVPLQMQTEEAQLQIQLNNATEAVSENEREVGSLNEKLTQMSSDEKLGELLLEQRSLQEQLDDAMKRWAVLVVCRHLLGQARGIYERERQPQVIQEAGKFLDTITSSRYRLVSPVADSIIQLEDASLKRKEENTWSSGLADQVYLAIRLGLACEFGRHAEPLPVILDDVLVKFDPSRQFGAAKVILDFARDQQVLLFTCHPEFEQIIEQGAKDSQSRGVTVAYYAVSDGVISRRS